MKDGQILWTNISQMQPDTGVKKHTHDYLYMVQALEGTLHFLLDETVDSRYCACPQGHSPPLLE